MNSNIHVLWSDMTLTDEEWEEEHDNNQSEKRAKVVENAVIGESSLVNGDSNAVILENGFSGRNTLDPSSYFPNYFNTRW